jgi:hypothetical protein
MYVKITTGDVYFRVSKPEIHVFDLIVGVLTPLLAILQLYHGDQF